MENSSSTYKDIFYNKDPKNTSILFYYIFLNFYINANRKKSMFELCENNNRTFTRSSYNFPFMKKQDNYHYFYLNDYLKDLMFHEKVDYDVLYSFLANYKYNNREINNYNVYLLILLLKEKWNIDFKFIKDYSFKNDSNFTKKNFS